jgi:hypothetical protein
MKLSGCGKAKHLQKGKVYDWDERMIVTMVWTFLGFHFIGAFPKAQILSASYYVEQIPQRILKLHYESNGKYLVIHIHNASPHTFWKSKMFCKANSLRIAPHFPYYLGSTLSEFFFVIWSIAWKEPPSVRKRNSFSKRMKIWGEFHQILCGLNMTIR